MSTAARQEARSPFAWFMIGRFHIVAIAYFAALVFGWQFTGLWGFPMAAFVALDWCLVNLMNRVVDLPEDAQNGIPGTAVVAALAKPITLLAGAALVGSFVASTLLLPALTPFRLAYHALGVAYNYPVLPGRRRLKTMYGLKNLASCVGFLLTVFCYPLASLGPVTMRLDGIVCVLLFFFLLECAFEILYDMRDVEGDRAEGVRTYPVVDGMPRAIQYVDGMLAGSAFSLVFGYAVGMLRWREAVMVAAPAFVFWFYKRRLARGLTTADCVVATLAGAGMLAAYMAWIWLGLPLDLIPSTAR